MADSLFPQFVQPQAAQTHAPDALPLLIDAAWDFENDRAVFRDGEPVLVTGLEALRVWCWHALHTPRGRYALYSLGYGSDLAQLVGTSWSGELKTAEARQYLEECLLASPYVRAVRSIALQFAGDSLTASFIVESVYGTAKMEV